MVKELSLPNYFTHIWSENSSIHAFPRDISTIWNVNSLIQNFNTARHVYFLQRYPLHHGHHNMAVI